jgi:hypothetical protein
MTSVFNWRWNLNYDPDLYLLITWSKRTVVSSFCFQSGWLAKCENYYFGWQLGNLVSEQVDFFGRCRCEAECGMQKTYTIRAAPTLGTDQIRQSRPCLRIVRQDTEGQPSFCSKLSTQPVDLFWRPFLTVRLYCRKQRIGCASASDLSRWPAKSLSSLILAWYQVAFTPTYSPGNRFSAENLTSRGIVALHLKSNDGARNC